MTKSTLHEPGREIPVAGEYDVVICGGGPTAMGAALAAAGEGAKTLAIERHAMLGGLWTAGLLNPLFDPHKGWMVDRLIARLNQELRQFLLFYIARSLT